MAITGSGTSADPYKPTTWSEFLQCTTTDGKYTELPEGGGTFDMEDYYTGGEVHNIPLRGFINGNGWVIKNAKVTNTSGSAGYYGFIISGRDDKGRLSHLDFIDFTIDSNDVAATGIGGARATASAGLLVCGITSATGCIMNYCRFLGTITSNQMYAVSGEYSVIIDKTYMSETIEVCSFNLEIHKVATIALGTNWQAALKWCNIRAKTYDECNLYGCFYYCYIEGDVYAVYGFSHITSFLKTVINATVGSGGFHMDYGQMSSVLVNTDKYSGELPTGAIGATTTEMKSETDLDTKGFTISNDPTATTDWHIDPNRNGGFPYVPVMLDIPENPPQPQGGAFEDAAYLKKVTIPQSCLSFGETAFAGTQLESVTINPSAAYSNTTFPEGCEVQFYGGGGDYVQLLDGQGRAVVDGRGRRVYIKSGGC